MLREKTVWHMPSSPFVIKLVACFNEPDHLGFLLEYAAGGDILTLYQRSGLHGDAGAARFYVAGVVLALDALHKMKVIHRNIRPENVLISATGQPKLTDMSLAKLVIGQTFTMCGAPNYMAPEVLAGTGHHRAVDWWCLGVMIFELMADKSPFDSDHPMRIYWNVMRGITRVHMPEACEGIVGELIRSLLSPQAIDRLPMRKGGMQNVVDHPWYTGFDWPAMRKCDLPSPWVPKLSSNTDISHFNPDPADLPQPDSFKMDVDDDYEWAIEFGS
jgi:serine/threonine protein kinase